MSAPKRKKIVFVCTGNTCRSPMAEALLKAHLATLGVKGFSVSSAGTQAQKGAPINAKSLQVLSEHGLAVEKFSAKPITEKLIREAFVVVCMTEEQRDYLMDLRWNALKKAGEEALENNVYSFRDLTDHKVLDPYGRDIECYRYVYGLLSAGVEAMVEKLNLRAHAYVSKEKTTAKNTMGKKRGRPKKSAAKSSEKEEKKV